ncbi:MAG: RluA family pseudouridine synthase [Spirochaetales bacterium]|nr:RluA family pseudouridine synthase [Spirochaetales bacterium]
MNHIRHIIEDPAASGMRIDRYISVKLNLFSRSQGKSRITSVLLNGKEAKPGKKVTAGDVLELYYSDPEPPELVPEAIPLSIVYEDENVIVVDKPQGMVVHPGCGNPNHTLVNALLFHCRAMAGAFYLDNLRPGIVHRLDKDTSGLIIVAKNPSSHEFLARQFRESRVKKYYYAISSGQPPEQRGVIETHIVRDSLNRKCFKVSESSGKRAVTRYRLHKTSGHYSVILLHPRTGRTHQLRVHLKHIASPILGDPLYGRRDRRFPDATLMLHAYKLVIRLPAGKGSREFISPLPERFKDILEKLGLLKA